MKLQEKESLKALIIQQTKQLQTQITQLQNKSTKIAKDCSLDALNKADMHNEHQREHTLVEQAKKRVVVLERTLLRVDEEEYGVCVECEDEIAFARLQLLPESLFCVECLNDKNR